MPLLFSTPHRFVSFYHFNGDNRVDSISKLKNTSKYDLSQRIYCLFSYKINSKNSVIYSVHRINFDANRACPNRRLAQQAHLHRRHLPTRRWGRHHGATAGTQAGRGAGRVRHR